MWTLWGHLNVYIYEKTGSLYTSICQGPFLAFLKPDYSHRAVELSREFYEQQQKRQSNGPVSYVTLLLLL